MQHNEDQMKSHGRTFNSQYGIDKSIHKNKNAMHCNDYVLINTIFKLSLLRA